MITIVGSLKGGSGKSTVTFNLAVWLAMAERRVRLIDADPQATLSDVLEVRREEGFEPALAVEPLAALDDPALGEADEVLIDVGTADMAAMRRALAVCDRVLVPVQPSQADIWSAQRYIRLIAEEGLARTPEILGFINRGDTHHAVRETAEAAAALVALPGLRFIRPRLSQRTLFRRSFSEGLAVFELEPRGKGAREFLALAAALYPELV
ncbi:ParA family protein [Marichromatium gracile]|uniref:Plasmid segregation oscillating ATPase ParF n=1 Tax=Marichromatium gracile TaxID=1048 RepID=A0A4R4A9G8_MARGR|nr:ParA family protein [Marichromatium gracile]MBK1708536.1 chromosome partitioning protein [Marichromatium gracile]MCF1183106.1 ParA family protein [Marichromatium gracile]TCW35573.1 plasmid segregation oscillating ATPase ParF [Marichromatium gracile]